MEACGAGAQSKDDVVVAFDDSGTEALAAFAESDHRANRLLESIRGAWPVRAARARARTRSDAQVVEANFEQLGEKRARPPEKYLVDDYRVMNY